MDNLKLKFFPFNINYNKLNYDEEGLWSITLPNEADLISQIIINEIGNNSIIFDGTAGLGGNSISFCKYFKKVISIEINNNKYNLLKNNIKIYYYNNIYFYNDNFINLLNIECDCYFFDPPWGGPNYKKYNKIQIKIDDKTLFDLIIFIKKINLHKKIFIKLPINYNFNEFSNFNYKLLLINKFYIIIIY